jgi:hypothetical protein
MLATVIWSKLTSTIDDLDNLIKNQEGSLEGLA